LIRVAAGVVELVVLVILLVCKLIHVVAVGVDSMVLMVTQALVNTYTLPADYYFVVVADFQIAFATLSQ
jgi:hypothetical protein